MALEESRPEAPLVVRLARVPAVVVRRAGHGWQTAVFLLFAGTVGLMALRPGAATIVLLALLPLIPIVVVAVVLVRLGTLGRRPALLRLGVDGVEVSYDGRRWFLGHHAVEAVDAGDDPNVSCLWITPREAAPLFLSLGVEARDAALARLERERRRFDGAAPSLAALARGDRPVDEWRRAVTALARQGASYREGAIGAQELVALIGDPRVSLDQRIGAALAIGASGSTALVERARLVAEGCVEEGVRRSLVAALEGTVLRR